MAKKKEEAVEEKVKKVDKAFEPYLDSDYDIHLPNMKAEKK